MPERRSDGDPGDWNQALMELGATVCVPGTPKCGECPLREHCAAHEAGTARELPRVPARKPAREVHRVAVVLASSKAVVLARRRPNTLFGGLWEPPSVARDEGGGGLAALTEAMGISVSGLEAAGAVTHLLSHRRLQVEVLRGALGRSRRFPLPGPEYDAVEAVTFARLTGLPQARLARRILEVANVAARGLL